MPRLPACARHDETRYTGWRSTPRGSFRTIVEEEKISKTTAGPNEVILSFSISGVFPNSQASSSLSLQKLHARTFAACWSGRANRFSGPFQRFLFPHTTHPNGFHILSISMYFHIFTYFMYSYLVTYTNNSVTESSQNPQAHSSPPIQRKYNSS